MVVVVMGDGIQFWAKKFYWLLDLKSFLLVLQSILVASYIVITTFLYFKIIYIVLVGYFDNNLIRINMEIS